MTPMRALVIGASGFLGSHVVRQLVSDGHDVRILVRESSDTRYIDDLELDRVVGELTDTEVVTAAMADRDVVFYCAVDTRAWLRDPAPLYETNVEMLRGVLDVAAQSRLTKFVFTSSVATIGRVSGRTATEDDAFNWADKAPEYVKSRVAAEDLVMEYVRDRALPAVAMCVANTYGANDWQPTPHGAFVAGAALGKLPFTVRGCRAECVGIEDAARALLLAADRGRPGERYIVSERFIDLGEIIDVAARTGEQRPPRAVLHLPSLYAVGAIGSVLATLTGKSRQLTLTSVRLMHIMSPMDHHKAERELGWHPAPVTDAIAAGARFWVNRRRSRT